MFFMRPAKRQISDGEPGSRITSPKQARRKKRLLRAIPVPGDNANKYFGYREAWGRIRKAQGFGFYLEAVTLEESIIADRLISFLVRAGAMPPSAPIDKIGFGQLVHRWMEVVPEPIPTKHHADLRSAIDEWRKQRNRIVHGMVKCMPGIDPGDVLDFLKEARIAAGEGGTLAQAITDWGKKAKRQLTNHKADSAKLP